MVYSYLQEGQIRLLEILPRTQVASQAIPNNQPQRHTIQCALKVVSINEPVDYEALSYVWGTETKSTSIRLDAQSFPVTANLHDALTRLQLDDTPRQFWIDAICINQTDLQERAEQVQQMRKIYQNARSVCVFLGESWEGLDLASDFFEAAAAHPESHFDHTQEPCLSAQGHSSASKTLRMNLVRFLTVPWWNRLWTAQEYVLARHVYFQCGARVLPGKIVQDAYVNLRRHENTCCAGCPAVAEDAEFGLPLLEAFFRMDATEVARDSSGGHQVQGDTTRPATFSSSLDWDAHDPSRWLAPEPPAFLHSLDNFRARESSDPRDKIYGLTGLYHSDRVGEKFSKADYAIPVEKLYTELVHTTVRETGKLDILSRARGYIEPVFKLPSFVPDWSIGYEILIDRNARLAGYEAAGGHREAEWTVIDANTVRTRAILLSQLAVLGAETGHGSSVEAIFQSWASIAGLEFKGDSFAERSGIFDRAHPFWRTICGNIVSYRILDSRMESRIDREERRQEAVELVYGSFLAWYNYMTSPGDSMRRTTEMIDFQTTFDKMTTLRRFAGMRDGRVGFFPEQAVVGDDIALLPGAGEPIVLRLVSPGTYEVIGAAYVEGIMLGEAFDETKLTEILLV